MYTYDEFKDIFVDKVNEALTSQGKLAAEITTVRKINISEDAIKISIPGSNCSPLIYLKPFYEDYLRTNDFHPVLANFQGIIADSVKSAKETLAVSLVDDFQKAKTTAKEHIIFCLINTEWNKELLADVPHRDFLNLSIVYRWIHSRGNNRFKSSLITNAMASRMELSESKLYEYALENTEKLLPATCQDISEIIRGG